MHGTSENSTVLLLIATQPVNLHLFLYCLQSRVSSGAQINTAGQRANKSALPVHHLMGAHLAALQRPFSNNDGYVPRVGFRRVSEHLDPTEIL